MEGTIVFLNFITVVLLIITGLFTIHFSNIDNNTSNDELLKKRSVKNYLIFTRIAWFWYLSLLIINIPICIILSILAKILNIYTAIMLRIIGNKLVINYKYDLVMTITMLILYLLLFNGLYLYNVELFDNLHKDFINIVVGN